tara:strand:+ start:785 stop:3022 length:2238 start_codon:yes stop_codon:yes gene_type:complete
MKILFKLLLILLFLSFPVHAEMIKKIEVSGNQRISSETIKVFSGVKINTEVDLESLNKIIKNLYKTNYFEDVSLSINNNILNIKVKENPIIQSVVIDGVKNKRILKVLNEQIELKEKTSFVKNKIKNDESKITNILRTNGFYFSKVISKIKKNENNTIDLIFDIELGERAHIKKISFIGDKKIKGRKLRSVIVSEESKFWKFISTKKYLDVSRIKLDERLLYNYYKNKGYYNVSIESSSAKIINEKDFELIFNINAGEKFYFGNFDLQIPQDYSTESFKNIVDVQKKLKDEIYSYKKIEEILDEIDEIALKKEFEFINAKFSEVIKDNNKIDLSISIEESEKFYIEKINIYGNYITNENVIRNSLIVDEGDAFNKILVNKSINNIKGKRIFKEVKYNLRDGTTEKFKEIDISVDEQPTGEIFAGAGTGTNGSNVSLGIKENNYLGSGIKLDTNVTLSDNSVLGKFSVNNPNFNNSDKSLITAVEASQLDRMNKFGYKTTKTGFDIGTSFEQYNDVFFSPSITSYVETLKTSSTASQNMKKQKGEYFDTNFNYSLNLNKLNRNFQPSSGFSSTFYQSIPLYAEDWSFNNQYRYSKYYSPNENAIISFKFLAESINSLSGDDVRISKRIYLPSRRLRGFESGKVGPVDNGDYIGGNYASALNLATTLPGLLTDLEDVDFSLFFDAGNVWGVDYGDTTSSNSKIRSSTGLGIEWLTPIGPLSFSFSKAITKADSDQTETFRFDIGTSF